MADNGKQYTIEAKFHDPYVHVVVSGRRVTPEIALDYWREIIDECENKGCSKILLEHDFVEMISMAEMLQIIGPVADLLQGRMLAFFDRFGHYETPDAGKRILRNHDVKMQLFQDLHEAEKWLLAN